ncbi:MAG: methylenetetrahydrofolate reductase [NAD(P)H] [Proteobacteria bacterium]|nr:methylenetetrahydrofolate reductase [NAD(P)H] [Pseudomonadota bacterium]
MPFGERADVGVSFEFFPPRDAAVESQLWSAVGRLKSLRPAFMSVTYGAGGSTREGTHRIVTRIQNEIGVAVAAHLTCVGSSQAQIDAVAARYWSAGIRHIVALRGDPPDGVGADYRARGGEYAHADDLVRALRRRHAFEISVAAFPEVHPQAASAQADLDALKRKVDAGATRAITQFFFDTDAFARFIERARRAGIAIPIVPGILPVTNFARACQFAAACKVRIPQWVHRRFEGTDNDPDMRRLLAAMIAAEQCRVLYAQGVRHFHFYTLNRAELSFAICRMFGMCEDAMHRAES